MRAIIETGKTLEENYTDERRMRRIRPCGIAPFDFNTACQSWHRVVAPKREQPSQICEYQVLRLRKPRPMRPKLSSSSDDGSGTTALIPTVPSLGPRAATDTLPVLPLGPRISDAK